MSPSTRALLKTGAGLVGLLALPAAAAAQQLWSIEEFTTQPVSPILMDGVAMSAAAAGAPTTEAAAVQVAIDYLRLGMGYLELPVPSGAVIEAENAVFEDRGNGNLMWTGEVPGAGYESVVFTVQDGHLVGWFGEPGGPKYVVKAGPDGKGTLAREQGPIGDWCGTGSEPFGAGLARSGAVVRARAGGSTADSATGDVVQILVLYPERTARLWRHAGGIDVAIEHHSDYVNMVWRNGQLPAKAEFIAAPYEPSVAEHPSTQGFHFRPGGWFNWFAEFQLEQERLASEYGADMVFLMFSKRVPGSLAGVAQLREHMNVAVLGAWGVSTTPAVTAHEVGHLLGGRHEPFVYSDFPAEQARALRPYGFAHTDLTSCEVREGERTGRKGCPISAVSYGNECLDNPETYAVTEPFYSSVRHQPNGWVIGKTNERENERLFQETVSVAAISNTALDPKVDYGWPGGGSAHWIGRGEARVMLSESIRHQFSYLQILIGLDEGGDDTYFYSPEPKPWLPPAPNLRPVFEDGNDQDSIAGFELDGLRPGGRYRVAFSPHRAFVLEPPEVDTRAPSAPDRIAASVTDSTSIRLSWNDNSGDETGFEVWYRKWSSDQELPDTVWRRYEPVLPAQTRSLVIRGMRAEEYVSTRARARSSLVGRYSFVVVAVNRHGFGASDTFHYEFMPGPLPEPTEPGGITDCVPRDTGLRPDGYEVHVCVETPDGARQRAWDYRLDSEQSGLLYFFDRDNVEILVKVLDGCAINGHRWVFVAPVTDLGFKLEIREPDESTEWTYDSRRRRQSELSASNAGNQKGRTARTVSDTTAFPCAAAETAAAKVASSLASDLRSTSEAALPTATAAGPVQAFRAGASTDCVPGGPTLTLRGGYTVSMCYETYEERVGDARDWGLDSSQSALMYFFDRDNVEVLIKVLDGCGVNGHRWVFVAPLTDLAFNLVVESPDGKRWVHTNRLGQTADTASDVSAFPCTA